MNQIARKIASGLLGIMLLTGMFVSISGYAQFETKTEECGAERTAEGALDVTSIFNPSNFFPIVPEACGTDGAGNTTALSLQTVPSILIRAFGAIASLVFYLSSFYLVYAGVLYSTGGINPSAKQEAINKIRTAGIAMVMILSAYTVTNTIVIVLGLGEYANYSVAEFFVP